MSQLPVWGIDVSASSLRAVKLAQGEDGRVRAVAWDVIDFAEDVEDVRGVGRYDAMSRAVKRFIKHQDLRNAKVVASIRGETAFMRTVTAPQLGGESLEKILAYEAQQQIPFPLQEVYWDRRVLGIRDGGDVVFSLYAIRRTQVDDRLRKLGSMGLPVDALQLRPIALQNFCAAERLLDDGVVVVDFDFTGLQILVAYEDRVWFRCLPTGGCDFVEKLVLRMRIPHGEAVKLAAGQIKPRPGMAKLFDELRAAASRDVAAEVAAQIRYFLSMQPNAKPRRLLLFTPHPACPPVADALATETGLKVSEPRGFKSIGVDGEVVAAGLQENFGGLARAAGLALHGLGVADTAVRLYPETIPRSFHRGRTGYAVAAAAVAVGCVISWLRTGTLVEENRDATEKLRTRMATAREFDRARIEQRLSDDPLPALAAKWRARTDGRAGAAPFVGAVVAALAGEQKDGRGPLLVALEAGEAPGRALRPGKGRLVLAHVEDGPTEKLDADLDRVAAALRGSGGLKAATPVESWSAAEPRATKPQTDDDRLLRVRFRHRAYELAFGDAP
jgi:type IV pilus assembly protein PilM